jgi:hypothetical protein
MKYVPISFNGKISSTPAVIDDVYGWGLTEDQWREFQRPLLRKELRETSFSILWKLHVEANESDD